MAIQDTTRIPETDAEYGEYLQEADRAYEHEEGQRAFELYHSLYQSQYRGEQLNLVTYRLAVIEMQRGNNDNAYRLASHSDHPGARDLVRALDNATVDRGVDPSRTPQTYEEVADYVAFALASVEKGAHEIAISVLGAALRSDDLLSTQRGNVQVLMAESLQHLGRNDEARRWAESGLPQAEGNFVRRARAVLQAVGVQVHDDNPIETEESRRMIAGITAYERGDATTAKREFEAVHASVEATSEDKARCAYYLGSMAVAENDFDAAHVYMREAAEFGPTNEKAWARDVLRTRWREEVQPQ